MVKRLIAFALSRLTYFFVIVCVASAASASILVNKAFVPTTVALGVTSVVTVTLSNTSTASLANITSFSDDIATMGGYANMATPNNLATTCAGGTASLTGTVVKLVGGVIPIAADSTHPGTCTVTFKVVGASVGNGINTIAVGALITDQGTNATAASQTLQVQSAVLTAAGSAPTTLLTSATATQTYTIANPTAAQITTTHFAITLTGGGSMFSVTAAATSCLSGSVALTTFPATTGTATATGLTVPANGSCTVTLTLTDPAATAVTVGGTIAVGAITDDQGITTDVAGTSSSNFITGYPTFGMSFSPSTVVAGATSQLTITITNLRTSALTSVGFSDTLPTNMTLDSVPAASQTGCGTGVVGGAGTGTFTFSGATVAAETTLGSTASKCTITVTVDTSLSATGTLANTIAAAGLTDTQGIPGDAAASARVTVSAGELTASKSFNNSSAARSSPSAVSVKFNNVTGSPLTGGTFTDNLPQTPVSMLYYGTPTFSGCSGGAVTSSGANTIVTGTGLTIAANSACTVTFEVTLASGGLPAQTDTNSIPAANVTFTDSGSNAVHPPASISDTLSTAPTFTVKNFTASYSGIVGQPITATGQILDHAATGIADTNVVATFVLNATGTHKMWLAASPNVQISGGTSCSGLSASAAPFAETFTVSGASLSDSCTVTYNLVSQSGVVSGTAYSPGTSTYTSTENGGTSTTGGSKNVTFYSTSLTVNQAFTPNSVTSGNSSTAKITLDVAGVSPQLANTQANGVTFTDVLPSNVTFATAPKVTFSAGCQQTGQSAPTDVISGTTITLANISLLTVGTTETDCNVTFDVTSYSLGNATSTIAAGGVTSTSGATNAQAAAASLTVVAGVALQKTFVASSFAVGDVDYVRFIIVNSSVGALSSGTLTDNMPAALALASLTVQPSAQSGDPASCGGTVSGTVGSSTFGLSGMSVTGATGSSTPGECVRYVQVMASSTGGPGSVTNSVPAAGLTIGGLPNQTAANGAVLLSAAPNVTLSEAFTPASVVLNGAAQLLITIGNSGTLAASLTGMTLADTLPTGVTVATTPNASTTCGSGTVAAAAGAGAVTLSGGSLAANASCTITVGVTSPTASTYANAIAAGALTTTQGATNLAATANLAVTATPAPSPSPSGTPALTLVLSATTTTSGTGTDITYSEDFSNTGGVPLTLNVIRIPIPSSTCFTLGSASTPSLPAGLTAAISYVSGANSAYTPSSGACGSIATGYDTLVNQVLWTFTGTLNAAAGGTIKLSTHIP
jgi:uncharacterized repeat protein (TIGR01451 family)